MACETTYQVFQQLLKEAIDGSTTLSSTVKASLKNRVDAMPRREDRVLGVNEAESAQGNASLDTPNGSIEVALGVPGSPNRVEFKLVTFLTPVRIQGSDGSIGLLVGHVSESANAPVDTSDITAQYRLSATDTWKAWSRTTVIQSTKSVQFAVNVANQLADVALPQLWYLAEQI
jgi:hypothetical protein